jgi:Tat protein secretion system quality control protein TatD with DNase activity
MLCYTSNVEEARKPIEAGFEYVCSHNETILFKKKKIKHVL